MAVVELGGRHIDRGLQPARLVPRRRLALRAHVLLHQLAVPVAQPDALAMVPALADVAANVDIPAKSANVANPAL